MEEPDEPTEDIGEELVSTRADLEEKLRGMEQLIDLLRGLQKKGADVYIENPEDSHMIHVIVKDSEPSEQLASLARMSEFLKGISLTRAEMTYVYDDDIYEVNKKFRTNR